MLLPNQSKPVMRTVSMAKIAETGLYTSQAACLACCTACEGLPFFLRPICRILCTTQISGCFCP